MRFGGEVHDEVRRRHQRTSDDGIGDVTMHELVPRMVDGLFEILEPARIGQLVERGHVPVGMRRQRMADEVGADEAGAPRHKNLLHRCQPFAVVMFVISSPQP